MKSPHEAGLYMDGIPVMPSNLTVVWALSERSQNLLDKTLFIGFLHTQRACLHCEFFHRGAIRSARAVCTHAPLVLCSRALSFLPETQKLSDRDCERTLAGHAIRNVPL